MVNLNNMPTEDDLDDNTGWIEYWDGE